MTVDGWNSNPFRFPVIPGKPQPGLNAACLPVGRSQGGCTAVTPGHCAPAGTLPFIPPSTSWSCCLPRAPYSFIHHPSHYTVTALRTDIKIKLPPGATSTDTSPRSLTIGTGVLPSQKEMDGAGPCWPFI
jgi:hypothetical protein